MRWLLVLSAAAFLAAPGCGKIRSAVQEAKKAQKEAQEALERAEEAKAAKEAAEEEGGGQGAAEDGEEPAEKGLPALSEEEVKTVAGLRGVDPAFDRAPFDLMGWATAYSRDSKRLDALLEKEGLDKKAYQKLLGRILQARFGDQTLGIYASMKEGHEGIDAKKAEAAAGGAGPEDLAKFDEVKADLGRKLEELRPEVEKARANLDLLKKHGLLEE